MSRVLTVFGGTGNQGGSVITAVNASFPGVYSIRVPTRDPNSDKAKKLASLHKNVELIKCDQSNRAEVDEAMKGAYAVFAVTNFWDPETLKNPIKEVNEGRNMVDAAAQAKVQIFIWSSLPDTRTESNGKYPCLHFSYKHDVEQYARSIPSLNGIYYYPPMYYENFHTMLQPKDDGFVLALPLKENTKIAGFSVADTGKIIAKVLESPEQWIGKTIGAAAEELTVGEMAATMTNSMGKKVTFVSVEDEAWKKALGMPPFLAQEMMEMFKWFEEYGYYGKNTDPWTAKKTLGVQLKTLQEWIQSTGFQGPSKKK